MKYEDMPLPELVALGKKRQGDTLLHVLANRLSEVAFIKRNNYEAIFRAIAYSIPFTGSQDASVHELLQRQGMDIRLNRVRGMLRRPESKGHVDANARDLCALINAFIDTSNERYFKVEISIPYAALLHGIYHAVSYPLRPVELDWTVEVINAFRRENYDRLEAMS